MSGVKQKHHSFFVGKIWKLRKKNIYLHKGTNILIFKNLTEMKIYNFKNINNCVVCGDINHNMSSFIEFVLNKLSNRKSMSDKVHPKELERQERLKAKSGRDSFFSRDKITPFSTRFRDGDSYDSTVIIVAGGCGISSNTSYISKLEEFNKILSDNNCYVLLVRGEMDDPQIFNGEKINMSNVKTIPDYSVVSFKSFNCLCIGGSVSIDRQWKKEQGERIGKKMYWEDEDYTKNATKYWHHSMGSGRYPDNDEQ